MAKLGDTQSGEQHPLTQARVDQGLSVRDLAKLVDMSTAAISHIETGRSTPRRSTTKLMELALQTKIEWPTEWPPKKP